MKVSLRRGAGHPAVNAGPYDQVMVRDIPTSSINAVLSGFKDKFWCVYFQSDVVDGFCDVLFFKPSGYRKLYKETDAIRARVLNCDFGFLEKVGVRD